MSLMEVGYRLWSAMRDWGGFRLCVHGIQLIHSPSCVVDKRFKGKIKPEERLEQFRSRQPFPWQRFPVDSIRSTYFRMFSEHGEHSRIRADETARGLFTIFALRYQFKQEIDWHFDPLSEKSIPPIFWRKINYYSPDCVKEVKTIWELNRHQHFVSLAKTFYLTQNERYAAVLFSQWKDWLNKNPYPFGINWTSALECSLRLVSWTWALQFAQKSDHLNHHLFMSILKCIDLHAQFIERHLSRFSSANNHSLGEALGLFYAGCYFPEFKRAEKWRRKGFDLFLKELRRQVHDDGVIKEQSTWYQHYVVSYTMLIHLAAESVGWEIPDFSHTLLKKMIGFLAALEDQGYIPLIGDDDGGSALTLSDYPISPMVEWFNAAAVMYGERTSANRPSTPSETAFWLRPELEQEVLRSGQPFSPKNECGCFPSGGYVSMNMAAENPPYKAVIDCGEMGLGKMAAHGHSDSLAVWMSVNGEAVLIDSGTFMYLGAGDQRRYFRSVFAHNSIALDGVDAAKMVGPFQWGKKVNAWIEETNAEDFNVRAAHDGFDDVRHVRELKRAPAGIHILDTLKGIGNHQIDAYFHLAPCKIETDSDKSIVCIFNKSRVDFTFSANRSIQLKIENASYSPRFGTMADHPLVHVSTRASLPFMLTTMIDIYEKN